MGFQSVFVCLLALIIILTLVDIFWKLHVLNKWKLHFTMTNYFFEKQFEVLIN